MTMAGTNPYIQAPAPAPPRQSYALTVLCEGERYDLTIDPARIPYGHAGQPGSILDLCDGFEIPLEHTCGGVCACSTCHVIVREGLESCNEPTDDELDQLEEAPGLTLRSRLGCQCVPDGTQRIVVEVPGWNRNAVKEAPH